MSNGAVIAIVVGALVTVLAIAAVTAVVVQRVSRAVAEATRATEDLTAVAQQLGDHQAVTRRELDRLSASVDGLRSDRNQA